MTPTLSPDDSLRTGQGIDGRSEEDDESFVEDQFVPPPLDWFDDTPASTQTGAVSTIIETDSAIDTVTHADESATIIKTDIAVESCSCLASRQFEYQTRPGQMEPIPHTQTRTLPLTAASTSVKIVAAPSPSWKEISSQVLPMAARELLSSSLQRIYYTARLSYARGRWHRKYSDLGNNAGGYFREELGHDLPPISSLPWVDRQLVREWRTYLVDDDDNHPATSGGGTDDETLGTAPNSPSDNEELDFARARTLVPVPLAQPVWQKADACSACHKPFGPTRLRHHCRKCGKSFCQPHSNYAHKLPHFGYDPDVPERVCDPCKHVLLDQNLAERVAWRLARCRDFEHGNLSPYFETGVDSLEEIALRISQAALVLAKSIPLGAQATVAVETVDVLRKHGLNGIYTIMLRQEFLAAADLLRKALGINQTAWPLSVHELSAAIFYALAQHRAMRGMNPDREHLIHSFRKESGGELGAQPIGLDKVIDEVGIFTIGDAQVSNLVSKEPTTIGPLESIQNSLPFSPVCDPVSDESLASLIFYAPMALTFIYATKEVDMQLLAAQQGWRLLYAYLEQDGNKSKDRPASALFVHEGRKIACLAVRGTATIHDVITDIRQVPVPFPENENEDSSLHSQSDEEWTPIFRGQGVAVCGMADAALNLYREHIDALTVLAGQGFRIRFCGHSLGGGVATLLGVLVKRNLERGKVVASKSESKQSKLRDCASQLRVYAYGTPSCIDSRLTKFVESFVTTVVLHDDVIPRLTPSSCRGLLKHLLHIRETWVKDHFSDDLMAITERAKTAWAPRWRGSFTLSKSSSSLKRFYKKQLQLGKKNLMSVKGKLVRGILDDKVLDEGSAYSQRFQSVLSDRSPPECSEAHYSDGEDSEEESDEEDGPRLLVDYMGGIDSRSPGVVIDGDEFFDSDIKLLDDEANESETSSETFADAIDSSQGKVQTSECGRPSIFGSIETLEDPRGATGFLDDELKANEDTPEAVVLEETPLPKLFIPGKIVHIYSHRGVYNMSYVPHTFRELRRISLAGNMLTDHRSKSYYEALLEVRTVRDAVESPPVWTAFDEDDTCSCCASRFTWASTSDSAAQEARDKHNCRSCGTLVCNPCSMNRIPLASIGITVTARVCDRCYNDMNGVLTGGSGMNSSYFAGKEETNGKPPNTLEREEKPVRQRERRSDVVDELASRIQSTPLKCS